MIELSSSKLKLFTLTLCNGSAVIRNQNRINGLLSVWTKDIPPQYRGLLAKANFTGGVANESIVWTTDAFTSNPKPLSELSNGEHDKYARILQDAMTAYANSVAHADENVKKMLYAAITYPSESAVFCADDRVVITEWGMTPSGDKTINGLPYSIDDKARMESRSQNPNGQESPETTDNSESENAIDSNGIQAETVQDNPLGDSGSDSNSIEDRISDESATMSNSNIGQKQGETIADSKVEINGMPETPTKKEYKPWWKKWWWWLILLLLLFLIIFLAIKCSGKDDPEITPVTPELGKGDVVLSEDSLRYVASNRILLLLTDKNADMQQFAKDFKNKYPDSKKYILSNADTVVKRLTLTLPKEERTSLSEKLPEEFSSYGLVVIPETMYEHQSVQTNDPALQDQKKRWYFDECSVFDAWETTKGDDDIVVAIIDDGFDLNHPELKGKVVNPYNAVTHDANVFPSKSGHGTHVAATAIGNADNGTGTAGIAPNCKFMPIQVGDANGQMSTSAVMDAVVYAIQQGADVVNMSLGMQFGPFVQFAPKYLQMNFRANMFLDEQRVWDYLFDVARQRNVTFVLAGGNENVIIGLDPMQRSTNTIKVSAVQPSRAKADFSNYGDMSTVSAPGVGIYNAIPGGNYTFMDGTSMASPIVAGGCALLLSKDKNLSTSDLARILRETGNQSPSDVGPVVNFANALRNKDNCSDPDDCSDVNARYQQLVQELEKLKREHPGCIQTPDTLSLPTNFTLADLKGKWKSTTTLFNDRNEEVVIYFSFNGTPKGQLEIVEPSGARFNAPLDVNVNNDKVNINQTANAQGQNRSYDPYRFVLKPDKNRKASGNAKNKVQTANMFDFNLVRI